MEVFDELVQQPDENGLIDLSHQAWANVEEAVWSWTEKLFTLNLSFNNLTGLSAQLGKLEFLRELDVSRNHLEAFPNELGKCIRLKVLRANGNCLKSVPDSIGQCKLLEEIYLSENAITGIPSTFGHLVVLRVLHLQNNDMQSVAPELGHCLSLEEIDMSGNGSINNLPQPILTDATLILWMCRHNFKHQVALIELEDANDDLEQAAELTEEAQTAMRKEIDELRAENKRLLDAQPETYLRLVAKAEEMKSKFCVIQ
ncbi:Leucine-rich repeat-containing protein 1 [Hondaea fermentalgiana]|uniref:Leucine-rich repeat-containing protein 1 n=1 Tax=Hondaea fermentalgiana TaxID=2315210 RepID=A0A2R5G9V1_9STRA|nr:Leucine-rich repeat-containing protein 1 [Hondaea fermentalgiana]|eukprot:GBG24851.1 Leucine-rich repeat-containing protein 1 [Hondaea fermentalgiana]